MGNLLKKQLWRRFLVICGLSVVAVAAPLLDLYGRNPEVFVANRTSSLQIVLFGLLVVLVVPLISLLILLATESSSRANDIAFASITGVLAAATGFVVSRQVLPQRDVMAVLVAIVVAAFVWFLVRKIEVVFIYAALALPLVLVFFLGFSPTSRLMWGSSEVPVDSAVVANPASLVFLQLDELPLASLMNEEGEINEALFPNFARLSHQGSWYRNAFSNSIATTQSVPAMVTGVLGERGLSPTSIDHPNNLFTLLGDEYDMHVIEWVASLCPEETCPEYAGRAPARFTSLLADVVVVYGHLTLPASARDNLPSIDNAWKGFLGQSDTPSGTSVAIDGVPVPGEPERVEWANWVQRLVNGITEDMPPTLSYAHLEAPHVPWVTNPSGTHYSRPEDYTEVEGVEGQGFWVLEPNPPLLGYQRHLYQLGFVDRMIGRILDQLDETGQWDDTMIVVLADHGESFVPGQHRRWPYDDNRNDLYRIPLFVKYPNQTGGEVVDDPAFGIDVLPTIVDALGVETDWEFDGISLLDAEGNDRPHQPIYWCCNGDGVSTDLNILFEQVERNHTWIPDQSSWTGIAGVGPNADLMGKTVDELDVTKVDDFVWSLDKGSDLVEADINSGMVQTLLTGRIEFPADSGDDIIVILNDKVAGVGFVQRDGPGSGSVRALVAEEMILDGHNDIEILLAGGVAGKWLSGTSDLLTLEYATSDGRALDVREEGSRRIQIDPATMTADGWTIEGWAADITRKETPHTVYLFVGDRLIASGPPNVENADVVRWFSSDDLLQSGFRFDVSRSEIPVDVERLTVIAEFDAYAVSDQLSLTR